MNQRIDTSCHMTYENPQSSSRPTSYLSSTRVSMGWSEPENRYVLSHDIREPAEQLKAYQLYTCLVLECLWDGVNQRIDTSCHMTYENPQSSSRSTSYLSSTRVSMGWSEPGNRYVLSHDIREPAEQLKAYQLLV